MAITTTLRIGHSAYDILRLRYGFHALIDSKGRPETHALGGDLIMELGSTSDTVLLEQMTTKELLKIYGSIECRDFESKQRMRCVI